MQNHQKFVGFADAAMSIQESITHGTRMRIEQLNIGVDEDKKIIDLSIGTLDLPTDSYIDNGVIEFLNKSPDIIHQFAHVRGFQFLRKAIAERVQRLHLINYNPDLEVMVTPGGIKGAISVIFHTILNAADDVIIPVPNWPHYADMVRLHRGHPVFVNSVNYLNKGLDPFDLNKAITSKTKLVILGDCINPTGKVYTTEELTNIARVIAHHNKNRQLIGESPIYVMYDCPYEAHILNERPKAFSSIIVDDYVMRDIVVTVTGPGKTYGMHGDRIGYMYGSSSFIEVAANVQVNLNSFACTYGQIACFYALHERMDHVAIDRATKARQNLMQMLNMLHSYNISVSQPQGGYFIFADFSEYSSKYQRLGFDRADQFLLEKARVATISGLYFAQNESNIDQFKDCVRINCGRNISLLHRAALQINEAIRAL
jgi:aspartate aminotransferase